MFPNLLWASFKTESRTWDAWADYLWWQEQDRKLLRRLNELIRDIQRDPYSGIGHPEALRGGLSGWWSRRINSEHRIVYRVTEDRVEIVSCRGHYED